MKEMQINDLPDDILQLLFSYITNHDLLTITHTCTRWNRLANDDVNWKPVYEQYYHSTYTYPKHTINFRTNYILLRKHNWFKFNKQRVENHVKEILAWIAYPFLLFFFMCIAFLCIWAWVVRLFISNVFVTPVVLALSTMEASVILTKCLFECMVFFMFSAPVVVLKMIEAGERLYEELVEILKGANNEYNARSECKECHK
jgi:hypothetical protein